MEYVNVTSGYHFDKGWRIDADVTFNSGGVSSAEGRSMVSPALLLVCKKIW